MASHDRQHRQAKGIACLCALTQARQGFGLPAPPPGRNK
jgi:hypothetical protein